MCHEIGHACKVYYIPNKVKLSVLVSSQSTFFDITVWESPQSDLTVLMMRETCTALRDPTVRPESQVRPNDMDDFAKLDLHGRCRDGAIAKLGALLRNACVQTVLIRSLVAKLRLIR